MIETIHSYYPSGTAGRDIRVQYSQEISRIACSCYKKGWLVAVDYYCSYVHLQ